MARTKFKFRCASENSESNGQSVLATHTTAMVLLQAIPPESLDCTNKQTADVEARTTSLNLSLIERITVTWPILTGYLSYEKWSQLSGLN